jgi:ribosomal-protein-alanine N-acetyltransferase
VRSLGRITRRTERLLLRPFAETDADEFVRLIEASREAWAPWTPASERAVSGGELFRRELRRTEAGAGSGTHLRLGAFVHVGRSLVGIFALNEIVRGVFQSAHASWQIAGDRMGQGLGTEGVRAILDIAFDQPPEGIGLHRVQANIMPSNTPSLRIAEKIGFRREGLAERYLKIAGRWEDHAMFAITSEEWSSVG